MKDRRDDTACDLCGRFVDRRDIRTAVVTRGDGLTFYRDACGHCARTAA